MKVLRIIVIILVILSTFGICFAEEPDLTTLSVDELMALRQKINAELMTRPEAEDMILEAGEYLVGKDIKPGSYYAIPASGGTQGVEVFTDSTMSTNIRYYHCDNTFYEVQKITLDEGNYVVVYGPVLMNLTGFPDYHIPLEGTDVPVGVYEIGVEIPAGKYSLYCNGAQANIYVCKSREGAISDPYKDRLYYEHLDWRDDNRLISVLYLEEGNWFVISDSPVIMKKSTAVFDFE